MEKYLDLYLQLIRNRSVTADIPAVNRAVSIIQKFLEDHGIRCSVEELDGRKILYASRLPGKSPDLLLNAHLDVVPAAYESQYEPEIRDGWVYARGAHDCLANAICACMILCESDKDRSVGVVFSTDEETGGKTAGKMVELGYRANKLICIMDSGYREITYAQKGILCIRLTARGKGGHGSVPWALDNPIDKLMKGYMNLYDHWQNPKADDQWHNTLAATILSGGMAENQVPDQAEMMLNIRYIAPEDREKILTQIREQTGLEISVYRECPPVVVDPDAPAIRKLAGNLERALGEKINFSRMNGATDARWFASVGCPVAIIGTNGDGAHAKVERAELKSIRLVAQALMALTSEL